MSACKPIDGDEFVAIDAQGLIDSYRSAIEGIHRIIEASHDAGKRRGLRPILRTALHARRVLRNQLRQMRIKV